MGEVDSYTNEIQLIIGLKFTLKSNEISQIINIAKMGIKE